MKTNKTIVLVAGIFLVLFGLTLQAWGGGEPAGGTPSCLVKNAGGGAIALNATVAVEALGIDVSTTAAEVDVTLRVERGGAIGFFRLHLTNMVQFLLKSNEEIACLIVDPSNYLSGFANNAAVTELVSGPSGILAFFGLNNKTKLVITSKSVSNTDGGDFIASGRASAIANIIYYAQ